MKTFNNLLICIFFPVGQKGNLYIWDFVHLCSPQFVCQMHQVGLEKSYYSSPLSAFITI